MRPGSLSLTAAAAPGRLAGQVAERRLRRGASRIRGRVGSGGSRWKCWRRRRGRGDRTIRSSSDPAPDAPGAARVSAAGAGVKLVARRGRCRGPLSRCCSSGSSVIRSRSRFSRRSVRRTGPCATSRSSRRRPDEWSALWASLWISLATVALAAAIGVPLAFLFERAEFPGRRSLGALVALPVAPAAARRRRRLSFSLRGERLRFARRAGDAAARVAALAALGPRGDPPRARVFDVRLFLSLHAGGPRPARLRLPRGGQEPRRAGGARTAFARDAAASRARPFAAPRSSRS